MPGWLAGRRSHATPAAGLAGGGGEVGGWHDAWRVRAVWRDALASAPSAPVLMILL